MDSTATNDKYSIEPLLHLAACRRSRLPQKPNDVDYPHKHWLGGNTNGPEIQNG